MSGKKNIIYRKSGFGRPGASVDSGRGGGLAVSSDEHPQILIPVIGSGAHVAMVAVVDNASGIGKTFMK